MVHLQYLSEKNKNNTELASILLVFGPPSPQMVKKRVLFCCFIIFYLLK